MDGFWEGKNWNTGKPHDLKMGKSDWFPVKMFPLNQSIDFGVGSNMALVLGEVIFRVSLVSTTSTAMIQDSTDFNEFGEENSEILLIMVNING